MTGTKNLFENIPVCLVQASKTSNPNEDVILSSNEHLSVLTLPDCNDLVQTQGNIILRLLPKPKIVLEIKSGSTVFIEALRLNKELLVKTKTSKYKCSVININQHNLGLFEVTLASANHVLNNEADRLKYLTFNLINFPIANGKGVRGRNNPNFVWNSRLELQDDDWDITFDLIEDHKAVQKELKKSDGFAVTYAGIIRRKDHQPYNSIELSRLINKLYHFISFARGANSAVFNLQGFDANEEMVWQDLSLQTTSRWSLTQHNWFCDQHSYEQLSNLFPKWSNLYDDELWEKQIPQVLYWYFYAGRNTEGAGTDGSLIIAIAALELFSFNFLVVKTQLRTNNKFESNNLSKNISQTLSVLEIPVNLPKHPPNLYDYAIRKNWQSGPKAIVEIRNEIVHPNRESNPNSYVCYEALELALWYIELMILKLCEYQGIYSNRLRQPKWAGEVEYVPWMQS